MYEKTLSLLLVEDNPGDADLICERLTDLPGFSFELSKAASLRAAFAVLESRHIDVVVLDLNLPDSTGLETVRELRSHRGDIAIVVLSGDAREELRRLALREGAQDFIAKGEPDVRLLARSVLFACERQRALKGVQQIEQMVASNPDAVIVTDMTGVIRFVNRAALELFGKEREELIGESLELSKDGEVKEIQLAVGSETRSAEMRVAPFVWDDRPAFLAVIRDVTERQKLADQLRQAQKMEAVGRLAGGIAHDFNNLLTAILGYGSILDERLAEDPELRSFAAQMVEAAEKATALTRQLLAFGRKQVLKPRVVDLNEVVRSIENLLRRVIGEDIQLRFSFPSSPSRIQADPSQIEQVVLNLAINARDAMPEGGRLSFEISQARLDASYVSSHAEVEPGPYVVLTVSDTGKGMDKETLARIFEPFFTTKELGKGTGLGLATVYGIVKQSGGHIWAYSEPGLGTSFKAYFPESSAESRPFDRATLDGLSHGGNETILIVEDDEAVREFVGITLAAAGYQALAAADGKEALRLAGQRDDPIDLLVSDVILPEMDGPKLAETLRIKHPSLRVLFVSGYALDVGIYHGILGPGVAFLEKPFSSESLRRKIREVLEEPTTEDR